MTNRQRRAAAHKQIADSLHEMQAEQARILNDREDRIQELETRIAELESLILRTSRLCLTNS